MKGLGSTRGRYVRSLVALAMLFISMAACNAISGLDQDYALATPGATAEGGEGEGDGRTDDGNNVSNDGAMTDGVTSDVVKTDSGGPFSCATAPKPNFFCSDFEGAPNWQWDAVVASGGTPIVEPNIGANNSHGFHTTLTAAGSKSSGVTKSIPITWSADQTVTLSFAFKIKQDSVYASLGVIEFNNVEYGLAVYPINCANGAPCVDENDNTDFKPHNAADSLKYNVDQWYSAVVKVIRKGTKFGGSVAVDGTMLDNNHPSSGALPGPGDTTFVPTPTTPTAFTVKVGAIYSGTPGTVEVIIDNVLVQ